MIIFPASLPAACLSGSEAGTIIIKHPYDQHWSSSGLCSLPTAILSVHKCTFKKPSVKLLQFADDTTLIGLIQDGDESAYRQEVKELAVWCSLNNLELNMLKTVEMIVNFWRKGLAKSLSLDPSHPAHSVIKLLPSGWHYRALSTRTARHRNSFFPQAIHLMNTWH